MKKLTRILSHVAAFLAVWLGQANGPSRRFLRRRGLAFAIRVCGETLRKARVFHEVRVGGLNGPLICMDRVWLHTDASNRYLKAQHPSGNEGREMAQFLAERGIASPNKVVDVGANVGEISLYFAKTFPDCSVLAIEPSPWNLEWFSRNLEANGRPSNIQIAEVAVSDGVSETVTLYGRGGQATLFVPSDTAVEVPATLFRNIWNDYGCGEVDFVKIDIEGAEPLLLDCLTTLAPKSKVWLIEFGPKAPRESYAGFFEVFARFGYFAAERGTGEVFDDLKSARDYFLVEKSNVTLDVYFFAGS